MWELSVVKCFLFYSGVMILTCSDKLTLTCCWPLVALLHFSPGDAVQYLRDTGVGPGPAPCWLHLLQQWWGLACVQLHLSRWGPITKQPGQSDELRPRLILCMFCPWTPGAHLDLCYTWWRPCEPAGGAEEELFPVSESEGQGEPHDPPTSADQPEETPGWEPIREQREQWHR